MKELLINLMLFEGETDLDFSDLDEDVKDDDDLNEDDKDNKDDKNKKDDDKDDQKSWFLPGIARTEKDALKLYKKNQQVIKQVQEKNKQLSDQVKGGDDVTPPVPTPGAPGVPQDDYDKAIAELGITENDFLLKPAETNKKVMQYYMKNIIPQQVLKPVLAETGNIKADLLRKELMRTYPNFDLASQEKKISDIAKKQYHADYIRQNPLKVFGAIITKLGGKAVAVKNKAGDPYTEQPNGGSTITQATKKTADGIRERIKTASKKGGLFS